MSQAFDDTYKKEIVNRMISRSSSNLYFLEDFLFYHNAKDGAYFRSLCILLSYSFELALKAIFLIGSDIIQKELIEKELKMLNHDILKIYNKIKKDDLNKIGIKNINTSNNNFVGYIVKTCDSREIFIENFIDIRYDFMNDSLRNLPENEDFKMWVTETLNIVKKIKQKL